MEILFLGGDKRMITAYECLSKKYKVTSLGLFDGDSGDIASADMIVLPVPTTRNGEDVYCPLTNALIPLESLSNAKRGAHILTCGHSFRHYPQTDYSALDGFAIKNAISTAEGAIAYAVTATDFTLYGSKILIVGYGRVGKVLLSRLEGYRADITVSARKAADKALIEAAGHKFINTEEVPKAASDFDIIFNTVDVTLFGDPKQLENCFLFDLSTGGCVDLNTAKDPSINAVKLPGIPGKTAAKTSGMIIAETIEEIINTNQKY